ncbi:hypothetical protein D3C72_2293970 [compost metagenome]
MVVDVSYIYITIVIGSNARIGYKIKLSYSSLTVSKTSNTSAGKSTYSSRISSFL